MALVEVNEVESQVRQWTGGSQITIGYRVQPDGGGGLQSKWRIDIDGSTVVADTLLAAIHAVWVAAGSP